MVDVLRCACFGCVLRRWGAHGRSSSHVLQLSTELVWFGYGAKTL